MLSQTVFRLKYFGSQPKQRSQQFLTGLARQAMQQGSHIPSCIQKDAATSHWSMLVTWYVIKLSYMLQNQLGISTCSGTFIPFRGLA